MDYRISKAAKAASEYIIQKASEKKFGDITVRVSLKDGVPVKIEKTYCEYYTISKNACSQGHFYAAVNVTVRATHERATPKGLLCKAFCDYYTIRESNL